MQGYDLHYHINVCKISQFTQYILLLTRAVATGQVCRYTMTTFSKLSECLPVQKWVGLAAIKFDVKLSSECCAFGSY